MAAWPEDGFQALARPLKTATIRLPKYDEGLERTFILGSRDSNWCHFKANAGKRFRLHRDTTSEHGDRYLENSVTLKQDQLLGWPGYYAFLTGQADE